MKNISRRVFIKGMAVAAVATAASTVLTGCKLPVNPNEPVVVNPVQSQVLTIGDKTLSINTKDFYVTYDEKIAVSAEVVNKTEETIKISSTKGDKVLAVNAYFDGNRTNTASLTSDTGFNTTTYTSTGMKADGTDDKTYVYKNDFVFEADKHVENWSTMTVEFVLQLGTNENAKFATATFTFNR